MSSIRGHHIPVPRSPKQVEIMLTARCNLACRHCSVYGEGPIEGDLSTSQWKDIIRRLSEWKVIHLTISGGEPLVRNDFVQILEAILAHPLRLALNTNAMLVTDDIASALARASRRLDSVMVSLDGAGPETHDAQRAPGSFDAMAEGVGRLRQAGVAVGFYCTVTTLNVDEIEDVAAWALDHGEWVKFNDVMSVGRACANSELALDQTTRRNAGERAARLASQIPGRITGTLPDMHSLCEQLKGGTARPYPQGARGCGAMRGRANIWADGRMTPCDRIPHYTIGNVLDSSLDELWRSAAAQSFRDMLAVPITDLDTCADCAYAPYCTGGCPVLPMRDLQGPLGRDPKSCARLYLGEEVTGD